jgi:hypothetical protein
MAAVNAAWNAGLSTFRDPGTAAASRSQSELSEEYNRAWAYYRGNSAAVYTAAYRALCESEGRKIYAHTRLIVNPVPSIVDFYVNNVFQSSPEVLEDGSVLITPLTDGVDDGLKGAIAQLEQWGNWLATFPKIVRFGAATGGLLIEVEDDFEREKVIETVRWPGLIRDKTLDATGNVKDYTLQYKAWDAQAKEFYTLRKEVDDSGIRFFRNDKPFDPPGRDEKTTGRVSAGVYEHDYGFCPAVYIKHDDDGDHGTPAVPDKTGIDEANSLLSHRHDHQHKAIEAGKVLATSGQVVPVTGAIALTDRMGRATGAISTYDTRDDWLLLKMPDGSVHDLGSSFDLSEGDPDVTRLLESFERAYVELQAYEILKNKAEMSGAFLERMLAPAQKKLDRSAANYHQQLVKLRQMQTAISGWRYNGGGWTRRDAQQQKFAPYSLDSYSKGDLNFGVKRSLLIQGTPMEEEELKGKRAERAKNLEGLVDELTRLTEAGYSEDRAKEIMTRRASNDSTFENEQ